MQEKKNSVAAASAAVGLNIHKGKSKVLRYITACTDPSTFDGEDLEDIETFTYLDSIIDEHGGSDADVMARISKARTAYLQLRNNWNSKQPSTNTKHIIGLIIATIIEISITISSSVSNNQVSYHANYHDDDALDDDDDDALNDDDDALDDDDDALDDDADDDDDVLDDVDVDLHLTNCI
ncbi:unnamed protein product [Schistosoma margrebowiei]|uniref:Uncharacterized protein n=1 Tax=Schistosoma margrebowiei TaxID=48269 RepID=A0A183MSC7_9TREM|nr:unnamed protein product [Schistosoma margrebowiei]